MTLTPSTTKAFLRRAVALLDPNGPVPLSEWGATRDALLADVMAAVGVDSVEGVMAALIRKKPIRGPDKAKRKSRLEADKRRIDSLSASVAGSGLSRLDCSDPPARSNDDSTDVDLVAAVHTLNALRFQQMSV